MNCPVCTTRCGLRKDEPQFYQCPKCKTTEMNNPAGPGTMWMRRGKIVAAPEAVAIQEESAKKRNPESYESL